MRLTPIAATCLSLVGIGIAVVAIIASTVVAG